MVCIRFTCLLLGFLLSLAILGESIVTTHPAIDALANTQNTFVPNKELQVHEAEAAAAATTRRKWLRGWRMGMKDAMVKKEMVKGNMNTGANPSVGKCDGGKGGLNLECELRVSTRIPPSSVKLVGLIPFSSDYHAPKTHPPKNN